MFFLKSILLLNILFYPNINSPDASHSPKILSFYTQYPHQGIWSLIPKGTKEITFFVEAENTETVLFWLIPTGTETWKERRLIGYAIKAEPSNKFNFIWKVDTPHLYNHLHIQALGGEEISNEIINLITID